jgi:FemAB-related protein (PEP-CTERM system-associated)
MVHVIQCDNEQQWNKYILNSSSSTGYHQIGWKHIIEKTYRLKPFYLMATDDGKVHGILPLFFIKSKLFPTHLVSLPFLNYGGICADNVDAEKQLLMEAANLMKEVGAGYVEMHHINNHELDLATNEDKVTMVLKLEADPEIMWKSFNSKVRNQVRKAEKSGLEVKVGGSEYLNNFYEAFAINMRDLGSPVHSKALFENLLHEFPDTTRVFTVYLGSENVGGAIFISFKDTAEVPWASSKREYLQYCPNNLLYWEIIKYACEQEFKYFDFGRSTKDSGTYHFKKQWGAESKQLYWQYYLPTGAQIPEATHTSLKEHFMIGIWKRLPLRVTKILGPRIRKNISA